MMNFQLPFRFSALSALFQRARYRAVALGLILAMALTNVWGCEPQGMDAQTALKAEDTQRVSYFIEDIARDITPYVKRKMETLRSSSLLEDRLSENALHLEIAPDHLAALRQLYSARAWAPIFVQ